MYKICFYVPESHKEIVKEKMFACGAGRIGLYDYCCWETKGMGQYRPLPGSEPAVGDTNKMNREEEYQVEMVCDDALLQPILKAMIEAHPYEEPAYGAWPITLVGNKA